MKGARIAEKPKKKRPAPLTVRLTEVQKAQLKYYAKSIDTTVNALIKSRLRDIFDSRLDAIFDEGVFDDD